MNAKIFISHSSKDFKTARTICTALENRGQKCWIASRDVGPGENFQEAIVRAIRAARVMVLVFTESANDSDEIKKELALASRYKLTVIPVRAKDIAPSEAFELEFATRQWIDLFEDWENGIERLTTWIAGILPVAATADGIAEPIKDDRPSPPPTMAASQQSHAATSIPPLKMDVGPKGAAKGESKSTLVTEEPPPVKSVIEGERNSTPADLAPAMLGQLRFIEAPPFRHVFTGVLCLGTVLLVLLLFAASEGPRQYSNVAWLAGTGGLLIFGAYAVAIIVQSLSKLLQLHRSRRLSSGASSDRPNWYEELGFFANVPLAAWIFVILVSISGRNQAAVVQTMSSPLVAMSIILFVVSVAIQMRASIQASVHDLTGSDLWRHNLGILNALFSIALAVVGVYTILRINFSI